MTNHERLNTAGDKTVSGISSHVAAKVMVLQRQQAEACSFQSHIPFLLCKEQLLELGYVSTSSGAPV